MGRKEKNHTGNHRKSVGRRRLNFSTRSGEKPPVNRRGRGAKVWYKPKHKPKKEKRSRGSKESSDDGLSDRDRKITRSVLARGLTNASRRNG